MHLETEYEDKLSNLQNKIKKLESRNQYLEIELEQYKREEFPDPPPLSAQDSTGFDGMNSEYVANQLSTILGASISNVDPFFRTTNNVFIKNI